MIFDVLLLCCSCRASMARLSSVRLSSSVCHLSGMYCGWMVRNRALVGTDHL